VPSAAVVDDTVPSVTVTPDNAKPVLLSLTFPTNEVAEVDGGVVVAGVLLLLPPQPVAIPMSKTNNSFLIIKHLLFDLDLNNYFFIIAVFVNIASKNSIIF
jgi:hypothetical protein